MNPRHCHMVLFAFTLAAAPRIFLTLRPDPAPPIRIGVQHSLSGALAASERPLGRS